MRCGLSLLCLGLSINVATAQLVEQPTKKPMTFRIVTSDPDAPENQQRRWVTANGSITQDTASQFDWFRKSREIEGLTIWFDSPGGSIVGGIRLGNALRAAGARVAIGRSTAVGEQPATNSDKLPRHQLIPARGICFSSCAYAFLGGSQRAIHPGAAYGLHMFWPGDQMDGIMTRSYTYAEIERAQRISANLAVYLQRVGADQQLLQLAAGTPPKSAIRRLTAREIVTYRVATLDFPPPVLAGNGHWGISYDRKQARLTTSGEAKMPDAGPVNFTLEAACSQTAGFNIVRFELAPARQLDDKKSAPAFTRLILASQEADAVLALQGKDIRAYPARFERRLSESPRQWIGSTGIIPDNVLKAAARPGGKLSVQVKDGDDAQWQLPIDIGNLPKVYESWTSACARVFKGSDAIP